MKTAYKPLYEAFGLNVVFYRKRKKYTQLQLAELVDVDRSHISAIELGNVGVSLDVISDSRRYSIFLRKIYSISDKNAPTGRFFLIV